MRKKVCTSGQVTDNNMAHERCVPDNQGYRHASRICNIYCFPTAVKVARSVMLFTQSFFFRSLLRKVIFHTAPFRCILYAACLLQLYNSESKIVPQGKLQMSKGRRHSVYPIRQGETFLSKYSAD